MKYSLLVTTAAISVIALNGCSSISKVASGLTEKRKASALTRNPEQMRVCSDVAVFQPVARVETPQFQGMQTPMFAGRQRFGSSPQPVRLPQFTPVKVLNTNSRQVLVQLTNGQRGFLPKDAVASESSILAQAQAATPLYPALPPAPMPLLDPTDGPVDQAMLNNVDNIPLPESEAHPEALPTPQDLQPVDGVIIRKPEAPAPEASPAPSVPPPTN